MRYEQVIELLKYFRCYEYAAINTGRSDAVLPLVISDRQRNPNMWDYTRYNRIVNTIKGAVDHTLNDDEQMIINRHYMSRNTQTLDQISNLLNRDNSTITRWHKAAIKKLCIALEPLREDETEITEFLHMFQRSA